MLLTLIGCAAVVVGSGSVVVVAVAVVAYATVVFGMPSTPIIYVLTLSVSFA